jgi:hypothetical protein
MINTKRSTARSIEDEDEDEDELMAHSSYLLAPYGLSELIPTD